MTMGLPAANARATQGMSMLVFPLTFVSGAYVPVASMPSWLAPVAEHQPVTVMVDAVRCLTGGPRVEALLHHGPLTTLDSPSSGPSRSSRVFAPVAIVRFARR